MATVSGQLRRALRAGVLGLSLWALPHAEARACSCLPPAPPSQALAQAAAVFEGRVTSGAEVAADPSLFISLRRYEVEVLRVWKGELGDAAAVVTPSSSAACGRRFEIGERYLIYASRGDDGELTDYLCSRTRPSASADEDLAVLGPGTSPARVGAPSADREPARIEPRPPADAPPPTASPRGCAIAPPSLPVVVLLFAARRRRARRAVAGGPRSV